MTKLQAGDAEEWAQLGADVSALDVRHRPGVSWTNAFGCDAGNATPWAATTVHMRRVAGGLPDEHHRHAGQTRLDTERISDLSTKFWPSALSNEAVSSAGSPQIAHAPGTRSIRRATDAADGDGLPARSHTSRVAALLMWRPARSGGRSPKPSRGRYLG